MGKGILVLACAATTATLGCGGRLAPIDDGVSAILDAEVIVDAGVADTSAEDATARPDAADASIDLFVPDTYDGGIVCDFDASPDATLCTPPVDDTLTAIPNPVYVAAGSYGIASFVAGGSWALAPDLYVSYDSATVPLGEIPYVMTNRAPTSFAFLVPAAAVGDQGTFTVTGRAGNVELTAQANVIVTDCQPWSLAVACAGYTCGLEPDGCGGLTNCGTCGAAAPYCFLGKCVTTQPQYCGYGMGVLGDGGDEDACVPCGLTPVCEHCDQGTCVGIQDVCSCQQISG